MACRVRNFRIDHHHPYLSEVIGLSDEDIARYFDRPFLQAIEYVRLLDKYDKWSPREKMDCIEKINRAIIAEIDDYYAKGDKERDKAVVY